MIEVNKLTQVYKSGKGIFDVSFRVKEGEVFGYLGPNGAGKTTTIRNLLGFTNSNKGTATINGLDCRKDAAQLQNDIGYLPGEIAFFENMKGMEFLKFLGNMRQMKDTKRRNLLIERFELDADGKIRKMSKGMKQKLGIIAAFMHDPAVYILDEPTSGLDPLMQNTFMDLIDEEKRIGKTILMSSHIIEEVERCCDSVAIIREGKIVSCESIHALNAKKEDTFVVKVAQGENLDILLKDNFKARKISDNKVEMMVQQNYKEFFKLLSGVNVIGLKAKQQSLESVFMKYYGKSGENNE